MVPNNPYKKWLIIAVITAALLTVLVIVFIVFRSSKHDSAQTRQQTNAEAQLYDVLANAVKAPRLHVGMYREGFANQADADAHRNVGDIASSVSELDTTNGHYRSVWATNYLNYPAFSVGRCVDDVTYTEDYVFINKSPRAISLQDIAGHLTPLPAGHLSKTTEHLPHDACAGFGIIAGGTSDLATARLSDGVFPVTLSADEATDWQNKLQTAQLFSIKDEGTVQKDNKKLRKLSFTPKDKNHVNQRLYDLFYQVAKIDKIKAEHPKAHWQQAFISINYANSGSVGGYYLIDEATKLPVYSELYSTNPDIKTASGSFARKNIYHTKQNYSYPAQLTITSDTPLEITS